METKPYTKKTEIIHLENISSDDVNSPKHYLSPLPLNKVYVDVHGNHYVQAIHVARAWGFHKRTWMFNALKYILRAGRKDPAREAQDIKKAIYYLNEEVTDLTEEGKFLNKQTVYRTLTDIQPSEEEEDHAGD